MSEQTYMYEQETAVAALHQVEGFDPRKFMRLIQKEDQSSRYYLDVAYRKLWFRLCYPEGKIVKTIRSITAQMAIVEARVYLNKMIRTIPTWQMPSHRNSARILRSAKSMWNLRRRQLWDGHYQMQASDFSLQTGKRDGSGSNGSTHR